MMDTRTLRQALVVFRKELKDSVRDRRALVSIAFGVLIGPVLIAFIMNGVAERQREAESVEIPVVGQEHAPAFVDWLRQQAGVQIVDGPDEPEAAVRAREQDVVLVITPEFAERFRTSRPAVVKVVSDSSRNAARPTVERVRRLVQRYSTEIGSLRLIGRGVSPAAMAPLQLQDVEVSTAQQRAAEVLAFIPMFIIMAAFVGGMQIATDTTAGERERGSLEPLLVNPAPRAAFVTGKWLAATAAAMASVVLTTLVCASLPRLLPLQDMGIRFRFGPEHVAGIMAAVLPMCLFTASLQTSVATMARSFKEAQTYMGILVILPMIPGMMSVVYPLGSAAWMYVVPLLGPHVLLTDVMGGRTPQASAFVTAGLVSLAAAAMLVALTTRLFRSERIIFAR
jgi:sodium transport system permease protein